jgi:hypothetical protein
MLFSHYQYIKQSHKAQTANTTFENMENFQYPRTTLTNQMFIPEEI